MPIARNPNHPSAGTVQMTLATCLGGPPSLQVLLIVELKETPIVLLFGPPPPPFFPAIQGSLPRCPAAQAEAAAVAVTGECTLQRQEEGRREENAASAINLEESGRPPLLPRRWKDTPSSV